MELKQPINIIFIGIKGSTGDFMKRLAQMTGGKNITLSEKTKDFSSQLINMTKQMLIAS